MTGGDQITTLHGAPALLVRRRPSEGPPALYVHGATFPSALAVGYRFAGRSWMDDLAARGFDVWAFDFAGYGGSERWPQMSEAAEGAPLGRAPAAATQIARVVAHMVEMTGRGHISIVAHSWGTIAAALYATQHPERVARLCLFGPVVHRERQDMPPPDTAGRWQLVTLAQQHARFIKDVPSGHSPVLIEPQLEHWGPAYLASDPDAPSRTPVSVKVPGGPVADIYAAWSGALAYRPEKIACPVLVVRGEWDSTSDDRDAAWLLSRVRSPEKRDAKIPKGTHLMHLEHSREGLFAAVGDFLKGERA
ncbi:MAG: alpha/beta hydrolase [Alphaproteobacteria bacterium]|nr:alpha/beta hydrolase [Alphaproteobacteria bacterium]MDE2162361.1 alpha/beta hydrolase [Alphaproteobacteria bacterium]